MLKQAILEGRSIERIPPPPALTFQNLSTSSPVAKGMTDKFDDNRTWNGAMKLFTNLPIYLLKWVKT